MRISHPHITFRLNEEIDKKMLIEFFIHGGKAGFNFKKEIISIHPTLKNIDKSSSGKKLEILLSQYIDDYYKQKIRTLKKVSVEFQEIWDAIEADFFRLSDKIFDNLDWPKGKYYGYISILPVGARFLRNKTFQSCWLWKKNLKAQVIHELLHFQFYHLVEKITGKNQEENEKIWKLSEIFNDIVQREDKFVKLQGYAPKIGYPEHKHEYNQYLKIWQKTRRASRFVKSSLGL